MTLSSQQHHSHEILNTTTRYRNHQHHPSFGSIGPFASIFAAIPPPRPAMATATATATAEALHRPRLRRNSPISLFRNSQGFAPNPPTIQDIAIDPGDSYSDDDDDDDAPQPVKFSALTNALLAKQPTQVPSTSTTHDLRQQPTQQIHPIHYASDRAKSATPSHIRLVKAMSPALAHTSQSPRIVRVSSKGFDTRPQPAISPAQINNHEHHNHHYVTPAPLSRSRRDRSGSNDSHAVSTGTSASRLVSSERPAYVDQLDGGGDEHDEHAPSSGATRQSSTSQPTGLVLRSRTGHTDHAIPSSQVRKRVQIGASSLLRNAPVRRGFKVATLDENTHDRDHERPYEAREATPEHSRWEDQAHPELTRSESRPAVQDINVPADDGKVLDDNLSLHDTDAKPAEQNTDTIRQELLAKYKSFKSRSASQPVQVPFKPVPPISRVQTYAVEDQENMPPPTFKRNKDHVFEVLGRSEKVALSEQEKTPIRPSKGATPRKVLGTLSENTPRRQAPQAPPKMSILDAATKSAGAATTKSRKGRQHVVFKGQTFTQLKRIGHGGSCQVYCVMADNGEMFALKKVKLDNVEEGTVAGFLREVELLTKFKHSDRVVRLIAHEHDLAKQRLSLLMELGDHDFNRFLSKSHDRDGKLDTVMVRYYWKEMLECVSAAHDLDIVHSDLKPANFLSKEGRLKLIDFGIANAIDVEHTMNIHRENMVGTTNYMSPESLTDTNRIQPGMDSATAAAAAASKDMKVGKPSDVWSLGCVLYQMTYGTQPYAYITHQINRVMAIIDPKVKISFPDRGLGDVMVPPALLSTMRRCLQRDPTSRPTVRQLLSDTDPFLYPDAAGRNGATNGSGVAISEDLLARIIDNVVEKCKRGTVPSSEDVRSYSGVCLRRIREMIAMAGVVDADGGGHSISAST